MRSFCIFIALSFLAAAKPAFSQVYGVDDREDVVHVDDPDIQRVASSVGMLFEEKDLIQTPGGYTFFSNNIFPDDHCADRPFRNQPRYGGGCTAFLIDQNTIATAAHCLMDSMDFASNEKDVQKYFVLDYVTNEEGDVPPILKHVYEIDWREINYVYDHVIDEKGDELRNYEGFRDIAIAKLTKKVDDRQPLSIRTSGTIGSDDHVYVVGHPWGLPKKVTGHKDSATIIDNSPETYFSATTDTFKVNSGSPVFNRKTHVVEAIHVRGQWSDARGRTESGRACTTDNKCSKETLRCTRTDKSIIGSHKLRINVAMESLKRADFRSQIEADCVVLLDEQGTVGTIPNERTGAPIKCWPRNLISEECIAYTNIDPIRLTTNEREILGHPFICDHRHPIEATCVADMRSASKQIEDYNEMIVSGQPIFCKAP